jgi:cell division protein FtsL
VEDVGVRIPSLLSARIRGFRVVNVLGLALLLALAVGGYAFKAIASNQDAKVAALDDQIGQETKRIRMLKLEVARLGAGPRVEALARERLGLAPIDPHRDISIEALPAFVAAARPTDPAPVLPFVAAPLAAVTPSPGLRQ